MMRSSGARRFKPARSRWVNSAAFFLLRGDFSALIRGLDITLILGESAWQSEQ
jgi:hypothetical protein